MNVHWNKTKWQNVSNAKDNYGAGTRSIALHFPHGNFQIAELRTTYKHLQNVATHVHNLAANNFFGHHFYRITNMLHTMSQPVFKVVLVWLLFSIRQFSICHWMRLCDRRSTRISIWISNSWRFSVNNSWCNANNVLISSIPFEYKWCALWQRMCASMICMHSSVCLQFTTIEHQHRITSKGNPFTHAFHSCNFRRSNANAIDDCNNSASGIGSRVLDIDAIACVQVRVHCSLHQ